ncbi:MAG: desulfoferrodoxin family protein [Candidatus Thiodiazotropha sp.]
MDRRSFLMSSAATAAIATIGGTAHATEGGSPLPPKNLVFTQVNTGHWESKKGSHLPKIELTGRKVRVSTKHSQSEDHYIVRHTLLLADGTLVGSATFSPDDKPVSDYELPNGYKGSLFATSFCNRHDLWLVETTA